MSSCQFNLQREACQNAFLTVRWLSQSENNKGGGTFQYSAIIVCSQCEHLDICCKDVLEKKCSDLLNLFTSVQVDFFYA